VAGDTGSGVTGLARFSPGGGMIAPASGADRGRFGQETQGWCPSEAGLRSL